MLHDLSRKDVKWKWTEQRQEQFQIIKSLIFDSNKVHIFNTKLDVVLITDFSPYGVGAQLCNRTEKDKLYTVACAWCNIDFQGG